MGWATITIGLNSSVYLLYLTGTDDSRGTAFLEFN